jgi:TetR/AcrR family transcriptional regulator, transcriptional repressor for nem operon
MSARRAPSALNVRGATTRERLLEAARELFFEKGYTATGLAEILERADAKSGSFYHFFESKEALLQSVLERYVETLHPVLLAPIYARVSDPLERVFALLAKYREVLVATSFAYACPIGRVALEVDPEMERVHRKVAENFAAWTNAVRANLEAARDRFDETVDMERLATFILTVMEGAVMQSRAYKSVAPFDKSVAVLADYLARLQHGGAAVAPRHTPRARTSRRRSRPQA